MTRATAWRWCAAAGVAAFICSWAFGRIPGLVACGPSGGLGPILAFEFARTSADVAALFGDEPCRSLLVRAQTIALLLDCLAFIPAYAAFLIFAALACSPAKAGVQAPPARDWAPAFAGERAVWKIVVAGLLVAGLADEVEGALLYRILANLPGNQAVIDALWWAVHVKFALLGLGTVAIGTLMVRNGWIARILAASIIVGGLLSLHRLPMMPNTGMMLGFTIAWITLLVCATLGSFRPSLFSAP